MRSAEMDCDTAGHANKNSHYITLPDQFQKDVFAPRVLQIQLHGPLVSVDRGEVV